MEYTRKKIFYLGLFLALAMLLAFSVQAKDKKPKKTKVKGKLIVTSPAFKNNDFIPGKFTCAGLGVSPPIEWKGAPKGTKSFALICEDPDAPWGTFIHWVIFNIPADSRKLKEAIVQADTLNSGAVQGINSNNKTGYFGPCPPGTSTHRYYFKMYALDTMLPLSSRVTDRDVRKAMKGHVLAEGSLMGLYKKRQ